jgi:hypothetical protein
VQSDEQEGAGRDRSTPSVQEAVVDAAVGAKRKQPEAAAEQSAATDTSGHGVHLQDHPSESACAGRLATGAFTLASARCQHSDLRCCPMCLRI